MIIVMAVSYGKFLFKPVVPVVELLELISGDQLMKVHEVLERSASWEMSRDNIVSIVLVQERVD